MAQIAIKNQDLLLKQTKFFLEG